MCPKGTTRHSVNVQRFVLKKQHRQIMAPMEIQSPFFTLQTTNYLKIKPNCLLPKCSPAIGKTKRSKWPWNYLVFLHPAVASKRADVKVESPPTSFVQQTNLKPPTTFSRLMDLYSIPLRVFKGDEEWSASFHDRDHCASNMLVAARAHREHLKWQLVVNSRYKSN